MRFICHLELRRKEGSSLLEFEGEIGNAQVDDTKQTCDTQILDEPPRNNEAHSGEGSPTNRLC